MTTTLFRRVLAALSDRVHASADAQAQAWGLVVQRRGPWRHTYTDRRVPLTCYPARTARRGGGQR